MVSVTRVAFRLSQRLVTKDGHDLLGRASRLSQTSPGRFSEAVKLAFEWQPGRGDRLTQPCPLTFHRERSTELRVDDGHMLARDLVENSP